MTSKIRWLLFLTGGFFLLADRLFKYAALHSWPSKNYLTDWFGWSPWKNSGAIFGLPISSQIIITCSIPLIILVIFLFIKQRHDLFSQIGLYFMFLGAVSNLFDRIFYHSTIDYFLIMTGIINLADILILTGAVLFCWNNFKKTNKQ
ncbi:MAG: hypothetical protein COU29_02085 [Candidatus Magasanikbacteria bacterium CG10_big_fil_rev_8_21_14_0_10_36_32]|uniref:Uncharacterized protein n=1 Tax=Candidatus Magasanikbacteria bacterium CG10_big_fil_rev_8_21_14_0_10_36_32 TaxID=1974646 RepID=A0A2M6W713_9BACT|nr:MAG: hypothetical protein COU29_02085 [Candidatus Magasanikbacteria bacterium CG10_big_fil_rev_8_21_14_0_10_36_32]